MVSGPTLCMESHVMYCVWRVSGLGAHECLWEGQLRTEDNVWATFAE